VGIAAYLFDIVNSQCDEDGWNSQGETDASYKYSLIQQLIEMTWMIVKQGD
jgi:hypothetical protein